MPARSLVVVALAVTALSCGEVKFKAAATTLRSTPCDEKTEAFFAGAWPDDRRLVDGAMRTLRFPRPGNGSFLPTILSTGDKLAKGWGLTAPLYIPFSGPLDVSSLPETAAAARSLSASVFLTALDPSSPAYGVGQPIDFKFEAQATLFLPGNILVVRPYPGFPLEPKTTYALVVTTKVKDAGGAAVGPDEPLWNVLHGKSTDATYTKLLAALDAQKVPRESIAGATVFTTQPVQEELHVLRDWLESQPDPSLEGLALTQTKTDFYVFEGHYAAPNLQHGDVPYEQKGGDFQFAADGSPTVGQVEAMRVSLCVPKGAPPAGGFPVVLYSHGTGGNFESVIGDICADLAKLGIVSVGIDQVFHGPRANGASGCLGQEIELCFFNPVNVVAGRNNIRQAALDNVMLRKMLTKAKVPASLHPEGLDVTFSAAKVGFFGHSQGGLTGAVYAAFEPHLAGAVLSGAGGYLTNTILVRKDPIDLRALAEGPLLLGIEDKGEHLDAYHPALALVQALGDLADPANYSKFWIQRPEGDPKHLYLTSGMLDPYTSPLSAEVMATAGGVPLESPTAELSLPHDLAGLQPVAPPVANDVTSNDGRKVTAVMRQFPGQGHFPVFDDQTAHAQWRAFFDDLLHGKPVVIPAP
jgi:pimeloyl-ACP methyl ester carboxylesterase